MKKFLENLQDAKKVMATLSSACKIDLLQQMAQALLKNSQYILQENEKDMHYARENNLSTALLDRLLLTHERIEAMANAIDEIASLNEPVGRILDGWVVPSGLRIEKVSIPIGIIAIIFESRPNVTSDTAALCFKSNNVCVLKGGKEAEHSNYAITSVLQNILETNHLPKNIISLVPDSSHEGIAKLIKMDTFIDLVIPRGGEKLIEFISKNASMPVIKHDKGLCHIFIDKDANIQNAIKISINAKCQRTGVCNAMETLLVHAQIAQTLLPQLKEQYDANATKLLGCSNTKTFIDVEQASELDWGIEYLDNILSIKIVKDVNEACDHIAKYSSGHSEAIITENYSTAEYFLNHVDSSCVYLNASTRFTDGAEFGFGAEVGISTSKLHARGPMGINDLTTYKYKIYGQGNARA
ncbi:MAG: glutamate-5-semialdehyde dehydrogenase [Sulfurospirillum sp.]|nr:glutamate-5-semialdehyde dehydrogenase [Sulfurospirillum sp.]